MIEKPLVKSKVRMRELSLPCGPGNIDEFISRPFEGVVETVRRQSGPILVLGAGGKMGLHLSAMLRRAMDQLGRKDRVVAVSRFRSLHDRADFSRLGVETLACDLENEAQLSALPEAPTVFFLAGVKFGTAGDPGLLRRLNGEMPRKVASRFRNSTIVAFSTGCVYPFVTVKSGGAKESEPLVPMGEYASSCIEREKAFQSAGEMYGTKSVLIRLNYSVEFRYGLLVDIALKVMRGEPIDVTMGHANVIWQGDALNYSIRALELAAAPSVPLNVTGPEIISTRGIAQRFGELLDKSPFLIGSEAETAWLNDASFSHKRFGLPQVFLEEMMQWIALWVSNGGELWGKPTGFERRDGKF